jgi:hypothetical protein
MTVQEAEDIIEIIDAEVEDAVAAVPIYTISSYPTDPTLELLHMRWQRDEIQIPSFQRGWVWTHTQASQLIESFLLGLPIPGIFLYRESETQHLLVIDGQQRLRSIWGFFDGYLPNVPDFYLRDVDARWEGKRYGGLVETDRIRLRDAVLRAIVVEQTLPDDNSSVYHIFERLNTGGTHLNPQEVRNSAAHGPFNDLIIELNNNSDWRQIFGRPIPDLRMRDVELIVRFCALFEGSERYSKPMKKFLNDFMKKHQTETSDQQFKSVFAGTVQRVVEALGSRPFHVRRGINAAVFDSVMIAFARSGAVPADIESRWSDLLENPSFDDATRSSTTDVDTVKRRIDIATHVLFN